MWFWRKSREERELNEELQFHLDQEAKLLRERGQDPGGARRAFGNVTLARESTRETWGWTALEAAARDARFALRLLRKSPSFRDRGISAGNWRHHGDFQRRERSLAPPTSLP